MSINPSHVGVPSTLESELERKLLANSEILKYNEEASNRSLFVLCILMLISSKLFVDVYGQTIIEDVGRFSVILGLLALIFWIIIGTVISFLFAGMAYAFSIAFSSLVSKSATQFFEGKPIEVRDRLATHLYLALRLLKSHPVPLAKEKNEVLSSFRSVNYSLIKLKFNSNFESDRKKKTIVLSEILNTIVSRDLNIDKELLKNFLITIIPFVYTGDLDSIKLSYLDEYAQSLGPEVKPIKKSLFEGALKFLTALYSNLKDYLKYPHISFILFVLSIVLLSIILVLVLVLAVSYFSEEYSSLEQKISLFTELFPGFFGGVSALGIVYFYFKNPKSQSI